LHGRDLFPTFAIANLIKADTMDLLTTIGEFIAHAIQVIVCLILIVYFLAVNVQAIVEWKKEFTNN
jgi:hypothetical protein